MKITSIDNYIKRHPNSHLMFQGEDKGREQMSRSVLPNSNQEINLTTNILQQNKTVNKTALTMSGFFNDKKTPSFGCAQKAAQDAAQKEVGKIAKWITNSKIAHSFLKLAGKNHAVFEASMALFMAGILRPATILALPTKRSSDKEKNKKAAAHSIASASFTFISNFILFDGIAKAANAIKENGKKYGLNEKSPINKTLNLGLGRTPKRLTIYQDLLKNAPKLLFAPVTGMATIALLPIMDKYIISRFFDEKVAKAEMTPMDVYRSTSFKSGINSKANKTYKSFMGGQS